MHCSTRYTAFLRQITLPIPRIYISLTVDVALPDASTANGLTNAHDAHKWLWSALQGAHSRWTPLILAFETRVPFLAVI